MPTRDSYNGDPIYSSSDVVNGTITLPSAAGTFTAGDAVSDTGTNIFSFVNAVQRNDHSGVIVSATLIDSAAVAVAGQFELWVFDGTMTADVNDAAFTPTDAECSALIGVIPFSSSYIGDATAGAGGNRVYPAIGLNLPFVTGTASRDIYGAMVVRNAYIYVASEAFVVRLNIAQE